MTVDKQGKYLIFNLDSGKSCSYDLSTGETYGFSGKKVKSVNSQLRGIPIPDIINSITNEAYKKFLNNLYYVYRHITNFGTLLNKASKYSNLEQFFTAGVTPSFDVICHISEVPKGLISQCKKHKIILNNKLINYYKDYPDLLNQIFNTELNYFSLDDVFYFLYRESYYQQPRSDNKLIKLCTQYNYNPQKLITYIDDLYTYEALENSFNWLLTEFYDYVYQASKLSKHYVKYPRNFLSVSAITNRNYLRLKQQFDEESFKAIADTNAPLLERNIKDYSFIYPKKIQDIKDEAVQQSNCVASYVGKILHHQCDIMFLRRKSDPDKSLVTLEVVNNKVVQARGVYNRPITTEEREVIHLWEDSIAA